MTASGYKALEAALAEARQAYQEAQQIEDVNERRRGSAPAYRDVNYFAERLATAQLISAASLEGAVSFGSRVTFRRNDGAPQTFRIVGEDEADPRQGSISYTSPIARLLMGKTVGEILPSGDAEIEILAVD